MVIDLDIGGEVEQKVVQKVITKKTRAVKVMFNLNNTSAWTVVKFGDIVDGEFKDEKVETWALKGEYYNNLINQNTNNGTLAEEVLGTLGAGIADILTSNKKQELIDSNELYIYDIDLFPYVDSLLPKDDEVQGR